MAGWFYALDGQSQGPISEQELRNFFSQGRLGLDTLLWTEGMAQWQKASETALFAAPPPAPPPSQVRPTPAPSPDHQSPATDFSGFGQPGVATTATASTGEGLRIEEILRQSFSILRARVGFWLLTGLIGFLVLLPIQFISKSEGAVIGVALVVQAELSAILTYAAFQACCGRDFGLGEAFQKGSERFLPIMLIMGVMFGALFVGGVFIVIVGAILGTVVAVLLAIAFGVLAVMVGLRLIVSTAACVAEKTGPLVSIRRSVDLTDGSSWKILGLILIVVVPVILASLILGAIIGFVLTVMGAASAVNVVVTLIFLPVQWLFGAFLGIMTTTTYAALRRIREGFTNDDIAKVFD